VRRNSPTIQNSRGSTSSLAFRPRRPMTDSVLVAPPQKQSTFIQPHAIDTTHSLPSVFLSTVIAFFPKCPFCLAGYLSMFGSAGLALTPYVRWLYPILVAVLALHLLVLFQKAHQRGYGPFIISMVGAAIILGSRALFPVNQVIMIPGITLILSGSLWNTFSPAPRIRLPLTTRPQPKP